MNFIPGRWYRDSAGFTVQFLHDVRNIRPECERPLLFMDAAGIDHWYDAEGRAGWEDEIVITEEVRV